MALGNSTSAREGWGGVIDEIGAIAGQTGKFHPSDYNRLRLPGVTRQITSKTPPL